MGTVLVLTLTLFQPLRGAWQFEAAGGCRVQDYLATPACPLYDHFSNHSLGLGHSPYIIKGYGLGGKNWKGSQFSLLSKIDIELLAREWRLGIDRSHEEVEDNENTM